MSELELLSDGDVIESSDAALGRVAAELDCYLKIFQFFAQPKPLGLTYVAVERTIFYMRHSEQGQIQGWKFAQAG